MPLSFLSTPLTQRHLQFSFLIGPQMCCPCCSYLCLKATIFLLPGFPEYTPSNQDTRIEKNPGAHLVQPCHPPHTAGIIDTQLLCPTFRDEEFTDLKHSALSGLLIVRKLLLELNSCMLPAPSTQQAQFCTPGSSVTNQRVCNRTVFAMFENLYCVCPQTSQFWAHVLPPFNYSSWDLVLRPFAIQNPSNSVLLFKCTEKRIISVQHIWKIRV